MGGARRLFKQSTHPHSLSVPVHDIYVTRPTIQSTAYSCLPCYYSSVAFLAIPPSGAGRSYYLPLVMLLHQYWRVLYTPSCVNFPPRNSCHSLVHSQRQMISLLSLSLRWSGNMFPRVSECSAPLASLQTCSAPFRPPGAACTCRWIITCCYSIPSFLHPRLTLHLPTPQDMPPSKCILQYNVQ